jgi:hypothetical protein
VAEWFKAAVLKTAVGESPPWVRIPPRPPSNIELYEEYGAPPSKPIITPHFLEATAQALFSNATPLGSYLKLESANDLCLVLVAGGHRKGRHLFFIEVKGLRFQI